MKYGYKISYLYFRYNIYILLSSCSKKTDYYQIELSVNDSKTSKIYLPLTRDEENYYSYRKGLGNIKDSLISKENYNINTAKVTSIKVSYKDKKGKVVDQGVDNPYSLSYTDTYEGPINPGNFKDKIYTYSVALLGNIADKYL